MSEKEKTSKDANSDWQDDVSSKVAVKTKNPIYEKWWFYAIIALIIIIIALVSSGGSDNISTSINSSSSPSSSQSTADSTSDMTTAQSNAYASAQQYINAMPLSRQGLIDQLSSGYGDGYDVEDAEYAVNLLEENDEVDWDEEAYLAAKSYLNSQSFSEDELIDQLESDAGDNYTHDQAVYGAEKAYDE